MRTDFIIAILLAVAAIFGSIPMSLIPVVFPNTQKWVLKDVFYGGLVLTAVLFFVAIYIASTAQEGQMFHGKKTVPFIFMVICAIGFSVSLRWFLSQNTNDKTENVTIQLPEDTEDKNIKKTTPTPITNETVKPKNKMAKKNDAGTINIQGNGNIVTMGQHGDNTVINQAPPPALKQISSDEWAANSDGTYTASRLYEVIAPYPPGQMTITAKAKGITELEVIPQRAGMQMTGHSGVRVDYAFTTIMQPFGRYMIRIHVPNKTDVAVEYQF